jgi:type II secretory pathway pseudopilin PulG
MIVRQAGFTYLTALFLVATLGVMWAAIGTVWEKVSQREKEKELLLVGEQFRNAIGAYYEKSPGSLKKYPETLEDLLQDKRQLGVQRYLRKIYLDPMTRSNKWGLVKSPLGGIMGVYSLSEKMPVKRSGFEGGQADLSGKTKYSEWIFVYRPFMQTPLAR